MNTTLTRTAINGRSSAARILARVAAVERYHVHAERRASECGATFHGRVWARMVEDYRRELHDLAQLLERRNSGTSTAKNQTGPVTVAA